MATPALLPVLMNCLAPLSTYLLPTFSARVLMAPASEPASGSVSPNAPSSPAAAPGSHRCRCSSVPQRSSDIANRPRLTLISDRIEESAAPTSSTTTW